MSKQIKNIAELTGNSSKAKGYKVKEVALNSFICDWNKKTVGELWVQTHNISGINLRHMDQETSKFLNVQNHEILRRDEVERIIELLYGDSDMELSRNEKRVREALRASLWDNVLEIPQASKLISFVNTKRFFMFGEKCIIIPRCLMSNSRKSKRLNDLNIRLVNAAIAFVEADKMNDGKEKQEAMRKFWITFNGIKLRIASMLFSKDFKQLYQLKFNGYTAVALTEFCGLNDVYVPEEYAKEHGLNTGDKCIMYRDPVQNLMVVTRIAGFTTDGTIRMNSLVFTYLGGDHDGDKVNIVPIKVLIFKNRKFFRGINKSDFWKSANRLLPSNVLADQELSKLIEGELPADKHYKERVYSTKELLDESSKSQKFIKPLSIEDYLKNQKETVMNMRTVSEGTGVAGSFCNHVMEAADIFGEDLVVTRKTCNDIQQAALDSKHSVATGRKGFKDTPWAQIAALFNNNKKLSKMSEQGIVDEIINIMNGKTKVEVNDQGEGYVDLTSLIK